MDVCNNAEEDDMTDEFVKTMNSVADGTPRDIEEATDDSTFERKSKDLVKLYRVSDESGALEISEVGSYPLKRDMLDTNVRLQRWHSLCFSICKHRMLLLWILDLVASLPGLASVPQEMRRKLLLKMLWYAFRAFNYRHVVICAIANRTLYKEKATLTGPTLLKY